MDAISVAKKIGSPPEQVFKTLVARGNKNGVNVFVIPGNVELNLKKAATESGNKKMEMIKMKELLPLTGYIRGGCSPIGMKKKYPSYIDSSALNFEEIWMSAGIRGMQVKISPKDLAEIIEGKFVELS